MANILLTEKCVRSCPYCFAKKHMGESAPDNILSWDDFIYIADFFEASKEKRLALLGGEPTLHPHFVDFVLYLLRRDFHVNVFTSGVVSEKRLGEMERFLVEKSVEKLSFVCNLNNPAESDPVELPRIERFLDIFGSHSSPGFNIYRHDFDMRFLFGYINRFGLKRHIRLGLAHPIPGADNQYVTLEKLPEMVANLMSFMPQLEQLRLSPGFDCGFPMCLFTDEQLGLLYRLNNGFISFGCGPAIDVGPDMSVWPCFPLSGYHKKSLYDFDSVKELVGYYDSLHKKVRTEVGGVYEQCDTCRYRETDLCRGGCLAHIFRWTRDEEPVRIGEAYLQ